MREFHYTITDQDGIHARPAGELVKLVKGFTSSVTIEKSSRKADCSRLLALMGLGVKKGDEVTFIFEGEDEDAAYETVSGFLKEKL